MQELKNVQINEQTKYLNHKKPVGVRKNELLYSDHRVILPTVKTFIYNWKGISDRYLLAMLQRLPNLDHIELSTNVMDHNVIGKIVQKYPNLRELKYVCQSMRDADLIFANLATLHNLESVLMWLV